MALDNIFVFVFQGRTSRLFSPRPGADINSNETIDISSSQLCHVYYWMMDGTGDSLGRARQDWGTMIKTRHSTICHLFLLKGN